jgi:cytochrome c-type biogenesis protein CcmH
MAGRLAVAVVLLAAFTSAHGGALAQTVDEEARRIGQELQCPVCQGLSVADSPSQLATQMRSIIRAKLEAGEDRNAILAYFSERYGESVLLSPPRAGFTSVVWAMPYVGAAAILALVVWLIRSGRRSRASDESADESGLEPYLSQVDAESRAMSERPIR